MFPALLFLGSGLLDTLVKYVEHHFLTEAAEQAAYTVVVFAAASVLGTAFLLFLWARGKLRFQLRNVLAGIVLGIPNYFSIYYLIQLLHSDFLQSSAAIPVNNIGIVLLSALAAILFFKEPISRQRIAGLLLSIAAILMIALSDYYGTTT